MSNNSGSNIPRTMVKMWCQRFQLFSGVLLASATANSGMAMAAGQPSATPSPTTTPGIATPDEAVRKMAVGAIQPTPQVLSAPLSSTNTNSFTPKRSTISGSKGAMASPSQVMNNCRGGSCEFNSAQPPVTLGTASPLGINSTLAPRVIPTYVAPVAAPTTATVETPATKSVDDKEKTTDQSSSVVAPLESLASQPGPITKQKSSIFGGVNQQLTYLKDMAISSSKQFMTALPQIDTSLFAIGNAPSAPKMVSFNPRLTLGNNEVPSSQPIVLKQTNKNNLVLLNKSFTNTTTSTPKLLLLSSKLPQAFN
jgi:hypothetical protein